MFPFPFPVIRSGYRSKRTFCEKNLHSLTILFSVRSIFALLLSLTVLCLLVLCLVLSALALILLLGVHHTAPFLRRR